MKKKKEASISYQSKCHSSKCRSSCSYFRKVDFEVALTESDLLTGTSCRRSIATVSINVESARHSWPGTDTSSRGTDAEELTKRKRETAHPNGSGREEDADPVWPARMPRQRGDKGDKKLRTWRTSQPAAILSRLSPRVTPLSARSDLKHLRVQTQ